MSKIFMNKLLVATLPILERHYEEEYVRVKQIFKDVIIAEEENKEFFKSPKEYLKKHNALSFEKIPSPTGEEIPTIQDKVLIDTIRKAREMYKSGKINFGDVKTYICSKEETTGILTNEDTGSRLEWTARLLNLRGTDKEKNVSTFISNKKDSICYKDGRNMLEIDNQFIGHLANPDIFISLRKSIKKR